MRDRFPALSSVLGFVVWGLLALWGPVAAAAEPSPSRIHALILGINQSVDPDVVTLSYADDDAVRNAELFSALGAEVQLLSVLDGETQQLHPDWVPRAQIPTRDNLEKALTSAFAAISLELQAGRHPVFYFVYSGHGNVDENRQGYVSLLGTRFTRQDLYQSVIRASPADTTHILIDACNSYFLVKKRGEAYRDDRTGGVPGGEIARLLATEDLASYPAVGAILSTSTSAETHEWSLYRGGVFSHEVRSGLLGGADLNLDGKVTYDELAAFVSAANARVEDPRAKLDIYVEPPARDRTTPILNLVSNSGGLAGFLRLGAKESGRFFLEDPRGQRYADFNKAPEQPLEIALLPDELYYLRTDSFEVPIVPSGGAHLEFASLSKRPLSVTARGAVQEEFRRHLFAVPFGRSFYEGFMATQAGTGRFVAQSAMTGPAREQALARPAAEASAALPERSMSVRAVVGWTLVGVAAASGGLSGGLYGWSRHDANEYKNAILETEAQRYKDSSNREYIGSLVCLGVAASAATAALILLLWGESESPESNTSGVSLLPAGGPGGLGMVLDGRF